jgi:hypothetical protein
MIPRCPRRKAYINSIVVILQVLVSYFVGVHLIQSVRTINDFNEDEYRYTPPRENSPLNDKTLHWETSTHVWLEYEKQQEQLRNAAAGNDNRNRNRNRHPLDENRTIIPKPKYMLLLTNYGWNHPDQKKVGLSFTRCLRSTEYLQAIVQHPYFHPTFYTTHLEPHVKAKSLGSSSSLGSIPALDLDPTVTYYLFLDVETCYECNYPYYGKGYYGNCDTTGNRQRIPSFYVQYMKPKNVTMLQLLQLP